jgi:hypothetical protein
MARPDVHAPLGAKIGFDESRVNVIPSSDHAWQMASFSQLP